MKIYLQDQIVDESGAQVSIFNRGYLFGEGLFETFRSYKKSIPFLDRHLKRMEWEATYIGIPFPHPKQIGEAVYQTLAANGLEDARIKIILSSQNGNTMRPVAPTDQSVPHLVITCEPLNLPSVAEYARGYAVIVLHSVQADTPPFSSLKSISWLSKIMARREIDEKKSQDGILLNSHHHVCETTTANLFWVKNNKLYTPEADLGLLKGVTRELVMELCNAHDISVTEGVITADNLKKADEIFMTNSLLEIMPVTKIDDVFIASKKPGPLTLKVLQLYRNRIHAELADSAKN